MTKSVLVFLIVMTSISFAQIMGPKAAIKQTEYDFTITNTGGDLLKIIAVRATCGCTAANPDKSELKPGESTTIKVSFNSSGRLGPQTQFIYIKTNDPANNEIRLKIT